MRDEKRSLFDAILERADDDAPRLVFSDWLEEHGDTARAEFIRVQCQLARLADDSSERHALLSREEELLDEHRKIWLRSLPRIDDHGEVWPRSRPGRPGVEWENEWRRGFICRAAIGSWSVYVKRATELFAATPIEEIRFCGMTDESVMELAVSPFLERLRVLDLGPYWGDYDRLDILDEPNQIGSEGVKALAGSGLVRNIRKIDLSNNGLGDVGAEHLAGSRFFESLAELSLGGTDLGPEGFVALIGSKKLPRIRELNLAGNRIGDAGVINAVGLRELERIESLALGRNQIGDDGAIALANSPHAAGLRSLLLSENRLTNRGMFALVNSRYLEKLDRLELNYMEGVTPLTEEEADMLRQRFRGKEIQSFRFG